MPVTLHSLPTPTTSGPAPAGRVAEPSASANASTRTPLLSLIGPTLTRVRTATRARVGTLWNQVLRFFTDPVQFPESVYDIQRCAVCRLDVHRPGEMCPKQWAAQCDSCGFVFLDYFGNCPQPRSEKRNHYIVEGSRHKATEAEWRRPQRIVARRMA